MSKTRCKFECTKVTEEKDSTFHYEFYAVVAGYEDEGSENGQFFKYTPSGFFQLGCVNDQGFEVGKEYYIDISEA